MNPDLRLRTGDSQQDEGRAKSDSAMNERLGSLL